MQAKLNLRKKRTVSEMVSEIFNYLKIHIFNIFKALLIFAGPFYIVGSIFIGRFYGNLFSMIETMVDPDPSTFITLIPATILLMIGSIAFIGVIVGYMKLSLTLDKKEITLGLVYNEIRKYFWKYLGANLLVMFGIVIVVFLLGTLLTIVVPVLGVFVMMFGMIYIMIALSLFPFPIGIEESSAFNGITRSFQLIKNNWWRTFGFYILVSIIQSFMAGVIFMPIYIISMFNAFSSSITEGTPPDMQQIGFLFSIIMPIIMFISLFFYSFTGVGMGINYFSLVEQKEEVGLKEEIEAMNPESNEVQE